MSDNWYYVDTRGDTQGPITEEALITLYVEESIHSKTYIWNGETVREWEPIMTVPAIYTKIKHRYIHQPEPSRATTRRAPAPPPIGPQRKDPMLRSEEKTDSNTASEANERVRYQQRRPIPQQFDPEKLMADIRRGIQLRDHRRGALQQKTYSAPPQRLREQMPLGKGRSAEIEQIQRIRSSHRMSSSEAEDELTLSTSIDRELLDNVKRDGFHSDNVHREGSPWDPRKAPNHRAPNPSFYDNEVAEKLNRMRQKFGDVTVCSGNRNSQNIKKSHSRSANRAQAEPSRSVALTQRIAELKSKLDALGDRESWIVTRVENVFKTNTR